MSRTTNEVPVIGKWLTLAIPIYRGAGFGRKTQQDLLVRHRNRPLIEKISERLGKSLSAVPVAQVNLFGLLQNPGSCLPLSSGTFNVPINTTFVKNCRYEAWGSWVQILPGRACSQRSLMSLRS